VRFQYCHPGAKIHEWVLVACIDRRHFDGNLSEFVLNVWREYQNGLGAAGIAQLLEHPVENIERALEVLGVK
jgi:hypothetical protein